MRSEFTIAFTAISLASYIKYAAANEPDKLLNLSACNAILKPAMTR